jgi:D-alanyl-D-alanine carboxypeptidase (penicillin-binding protein 5/6)
MTALLILEDKPLKLGDPGPSIVITDADVQAYQADNLDKQSVVEVRAGEQLTEFQALEGLLIPSANNFAFTLANWDLGTVDKFVAAMNKRAHQLGLSHSKFADPAGASAQTVSTASDLVALGMTAMSQEVLAQIVAKTSAKLPVAGTVYNVNYALGQSGLIGIKTGSGFNQGANFLFAASVTVGGFTKVMFGCVMGLATLADAFNAAKTLIAAVQPVLIVKRILSKYQSVGSYELPWGGRSELLSTSNVDLVEWPGMVLRQSLHSPALTITKPLPSGTAAGVLHIVLGDYSFDVGLTTAESLYPPGRFWRLTRI